MGRNEKDLLEKGGVRCEGPIASDQWFAEHLVGGRRYRHARQRGLDPDG